MSDTLLWVTAIAESFSAIGTVAAVIVALWLARRDERLRLRIRVVVGGIVTRGQPVAETATPPVLWIKVTNIGRRPAEVAAIGWQLGVVRRRRFVAIIDPDAVSSRLPTRLEDGQVAHYMPPLKPFVDTMADEIRGHRWKALGLRSLRLLVDTSGGKTFVVRPDPGLVRHLRDAVRVAK